MKIDIFYGPDFNGSKLGKVLENENFQVKSHVIRFQDVEEMKEEIKSKNSAEVAVGHCYAGTIINELLEISSIAIDPPGIKDDKRTVKVDEEKDIIWSSRNSSKQGIHLNAEHSFENKMQLLGQTIQEIVQDGKQV